MTLTVGGNDVIHVIKDNITNLNVNTFSRAAVDYQRDCDRLLSWLVRKIKHYRFILLVFTIRFILIFQR